MSLSELDFDDWEPVAGEHPTWSVDEIESHPLFMTELKPDQVTNDTIEALQSVMYDDETPETLCENFKAQGNEALKRGLLDDAIVFYGNALETKCKDARLVSQVCSNLGLAYLKKEDYPNCVSQCYKAIGFDVSNSKAYMRGALASLKLDLYSQGIYFAKGGLDVDPANSELRDILDKLEVSLRAQLDAKAKAAEQQSKPVKLKYRWRD